MDDYDFEGTMITALKKHAEGKIAMAKATAQVYMNRPVGIGEHPQVMEELVSYVVDKLVTPKYSNTYLLSLKLMEVTSGYR